MGMAFRLSHIWHGPNFTPPRLLAQDMRLLRPSAVSLLALLASVLPAQGTPFKEEVDNLVRALRASARPDGSLGDGTALMTARVLASMGNCHRFYSVPDG